MSLFSDPILLGQLVFALCQFIVAWALFVSLLSTKPRTHVLTKAIAVPIILGTAVFGVYKIGLDGHDQSMQAETLKNLDQTVKQLEQRVADTSAAYDDILNKANALHQTLNQSDAVVKAVQADLGTVRQEVSKQFARLQVVLNTVQTSLVSVLQGMEIRDKRDAEAKRSLEQGLQDVRKAQAAADELAKKRPLYVKPPYVVTDPIHGTQVQMFAEPVYGPLAKQR
jgi:hypothetical protein